MGFFLQSFFGNDLPHSIWKSEVLYLPAPLSTAHKNFLKKQGWLADYNPSGAGGKGGETSEEAQEHVVNRFLNSAARMQYVCADPSDEQPEVRDMVLDQLGDGQIYLLDLAAGNGAGVLAMLSLLCELRLHGKLPKLPLNVTIFAIDYSPDALNYYAELLGEITPWLAESGISATLNLQVCDLTVSGDFSEAFELFLDCSKRDRVRRFFCVISAITGAKREGVELMHNSLTIAAAGLSHKERNSSWLWVEPHVGKSWPSKLADSVRLTLRKVVHKLRSKGDSYEIETTAPLLDTPKTRNFEWSDPHNGRTAKSHVFVMAFKST
ncbi:hypothetical protein [Metapseudomonas otitidis]|uniref:hypothetical protein n=1 Tax=Metapseudomonas otitidis TaxID=319939 RepID=UPI00209AD286|nr:hypothetical protein [Pseudomonas otitidis]MCO7557409.1 hypothetical protein [Pseudomonas otitidis]